MSQPTEIYDSELEQVLAVQEIIRRRSAEKPHNYGAFEREIKERFAEIGFTASVAWRAWALDGIPQEGAIPDVTLTGRCDPGFRFDPDQMVHEVTSNVLGLPGQEGVIKTDQGGAFRKFRSGEDHGHGHGHQH